jgi:hypothetical protein
MALRLIVHVLGARIELQCLKHVACAVHYELQTQRQEAEIQRLTAAVAAAPRDGPAGTSSKATMQKIAAEMRLKDERLRQLRGAIKTLETKLAQLLKDKTDL